MKTPKKWKQEYMDMRIYCFENFEEYIGAIQRDALASQQEEVEKLKKGVKHWQYVADKVYERWLTRENMNSEFHYTEIAYATKDLDALEDVLERKNNVISSSLEAALEENLFPTVPARLKAAFIVRECERIISGAPRPAGERLKTFEYRRTPRPEA